MASLRQAMVYGRNELTAALVWGVFCTGSTAAQAPPAIDVTTHHYNSMRTGWNANETKLSPNTVMNQSFGLLKTVALDEQIDAQPLVVSDLNIADVSHEVVYVVSENNTIYAIDVFSGSILQQRKLGVPVTAGRTGFIKCDNNSSNIGVTSTPVIDRSSNSLFLIAYVLENDRPVYRIFALDLITLADKLPPRPVAAAFSLSDGSTYSFDAKVNRQRSALALSNDRKTVYGAFASFCDHDAKITRGWIMAWDTKTLSLRRSAGSDSRATEPDDFYLTSIWMSGSGPALDSNGNIYFITGNSKPDSAADVDPNKTMRESVIKMREDLAPPVLDYFTPMDVAALEHDDDDFGSGAVLLIPDRKEFIYHLAVAAGKKGDMFLLDRDNLGKFDDTKNHVLDTRTIGPCWCGQSYYMGADGVGRVISSGGSQLSSWKVQMTPSPSLVKEWDASATFNTNVFQKGFFTTVSSDAMKPGTTVIWAVERPTSAPPMLTLWVFDASDGRTLTAVPAGNWPNTIGASNAVPVVANGKVLVASDRALMVFGLGAPAATTMVARGTAVPNLAPTRETVRYGSVVEVKGSILWLRTRTDIVHVDLSSAQSSGKMVTLLPGRAVEVVGRLQPDGRVLAEWLAYAPDSPALWKADE